MGQRRLFSRTITDADAFLEMPLSAQALYFHLNMHADDDGFVSSARALMRMVGAHDDDLKLLLTKRFLIEFEDGILVVRGWRIHNTIRKDRYTPTTYQDDFKRLALAENGSYTIANTVTPAFVGDGNQLATTRQPLGNQAATQVKVSKDKLSQDKTSGGGATALPLEENSTTSTTDPLKPLQEFWEQNGFGVLNPIMWQKFEYWVDDFKELGATDTDAAALIIRGMEACVTAGADKLNYGYLNGILKRYERNRFKSVSEVDAAEKARQERQANGTASKTQQHIELSPDQETAFKRFWGVYPSQVNESKARAAYAVALSAKKADPDTLFKAACGYARQVRSEQKETRFIKQAANWINEDLWQADYSDFPAGYSDPDFDENADAEFLKHLGEPDTSGKYDFDPADPFGYKKRGI